MPRTRDADQPPANFRRIEPQLSEGIALLDPHSPVWRRFTVTADDLPGLPGVQLGLEVEVDERGNPHCVGIGLQSDSGAPITGDTLRRIPVAKLVAGALSTALLELLKAPRKEGDSAALSFFPPAAARDELYERYRQGVRRPRQGSPLTDENLRRVSELYRAAVRQGDPPTQTVAEQMHIARSTAARWVAKARERGFLGPAIRGRAGEEQQ